MKAKIAILVLMVFGLTLPLLAQGAPAAPLTEKEVIDLLKSKQPHQQSAGVVQQRGVDFELTPDIEKRLRKAKAEDPFIEVVRKSGPSTRATQAATGSGGGAAGTAEEHRDMQAIQNELDPDRALQLVKEFETKYPNSPLLTWAYFMGANAYQQKQDLEHTIEYGEKSLKLKNDNLMSLIVLCTMLPQPQLMKGSEIDKEQKLTKAENYAKQALQLIDQLPRQPNDTDEIVQKRKAELSREPHSALGMIHLQRSSMGLAGPDKDELAKAEEEYQQAVTLGERPNPTDYYRLGEARASLNKIDDAIQAFTKAGELGEGSVIKTFAEQRIAELNKRKAGSQPAPKP
jgi:tetratricopeptide (TPR) repeat protein